jgi:MFS family permease
MPTEQRESDRSFWLSYADKYYATMSEAWRTERRLLFGMFLFTAILFAVATGLVEPGDEVSILGLGIGKISYPTALTVLSIIVTVLMRAGLSASDHSTRMGRHVTEIYQSIAPRTDDPRLGDMHSAFSNPHIMRVLGLSSLVARSNRERGYNRVMGVIEAGGLTVGPILVTSIAFLRLLSRSWVWPLLIFLPLFYVQYTECRRFWREQYSD